MFKTLPDNVREVLVFSDTCGGRNRNQYIASLFLFITQTFNDINVIEHKFMEKGHSKMEVDSMHGAIEHAEKHITITSMRQWLTVFSMARSNRNTQVKEKWALKEAYRVKELKYPDFKDLKALGASVIDNRTQDSEKKTVQRLKIKRMRFQKSDTNVIFFSNEYTGPYVFIKSFRGGLD